MNHLDPANWNAEYRNYLFNLALGKVSDYEVAEDLVQETFLSAWKSRDRFRGDCSEKTFLASILRNKIVDFYRYRGRRPTVPASFLENDDPGEFSSWLENQPDQKSNHNPSHLAERADFMQELNQAVDRLPETMGKAFRMWQINGSPTTEVTEALNISDNYLWVLIHRAKKALSEELGGNWLGASLA